jgi:FKBP-type peptidyl-prolyl cis-trans isomerase
VNYSKVASTIPSRVLSAAGALGVAVLIAGCGSSGSSSTITVGNENTADQALVHQNESGQTQTVVSTPTTGPLATEPTVTPPSGAAPTTLIKKDLIVGTGPEAKPGESVTVNYVGVLFHGGKVFDASWKRHEPFAFALGKGAVIKGWDEGIAGMKVGGRRELIIPSALAYGSQGSGSTIPPNAPLVFVVDLLGV